MDNTVGYVLLGSAVVPGTYGFVLAILGLKSANEAAKAAKSAADNASQLDTKQLDTVQDAVSGVSDALKALTGKFAPARVAFSIALLLIVASLFAFGVLSATLSTGSSGGSGTTGASGVSGASGPGG